MRFEDLTATPPVATIGRGVLMDACLNAVTQRELAPTPSAAAGDAAKAETDALKAFFAAIVTKLTAIAAAQDAAT
jgi:hypothetical protein